MVHPVPLSELVSALALDAAARHHIAIVGGGGKTTLLHAFGAQLDGPRVLTCTTKMGHDQHRGLPVLLSPTDAELAAAVADGPVMVWQRRQGQKAVGVPPADCDRWFERIGTVVIEADGSRQRPFKAPAGYEPVVPTSVTLMLSVIGADALGEVIADRCHRPDRVAALAHCSPDGLLSPEIAATVLLHEEGARKELPAGARMAVAITKVADSNSALVDELLERLLDAAVPVDVVAIAASSPH